MAVTTEQVAERVQGLIEEGRSVPLLPEGRQYHAGPKRVSFELFGAWRTRSLAFLRALLRENHTYVVAFATEVAINELDQRDTGVGILTAVASDLEAGYLDDLRGLLAAEVFSDFLGMAQHLADEGYHVAAASLAGAVLEDALRTALAREGKVPSGNLQSYNDRAKDGKLYGPTVFTQVKVWIAIRDAADHGEFDKVDAGAVRSMLRDLPSFMATHLGLA
jgi:hypothetical protein